MALRRKSVAAIIQVIVRYVVVRFSRKDWGLYVFRPSSNSIPRSPELQPWAMERSVVAGRNLRLELNLSLRFFPHGKWLCFHSVSNVPPSTPPWVPYIHSYISVSECMTDIPLSCTIDPCKLKPSGYGSGELLLVASSVNRPLGVTQSHISHTHSTAYILPCTTSQTQLLHHDFHACHIVNGYLTTLDG